MWTRHQRSLDMVTLTHLPSCFFYILPVRDVSWALHRFLQPTLTSALRYPPLWQYHAVLYTLHHFPHYIVLIPGVFSTNPSTTGTERFLFASSIQYRERRFSVIVALNYKGVDYFSLLLGQLLSTDDGSPWQISVPAMDWLSVFPPNSYAEILTCSVMVLGGGVFGR